MLSPKILGMGNPLLDISCKCDDEFAKKYSVPMGAARLAEDKDQPMYKEMCDMKDVEYIPGGATLNSIRVAQWALGDPGRTSYFGAIGSDKYGETMAQQLSKDGVRAEFLVNPDVATGTCACVIVDKERGLVANLAAANTYKLEHFEANSPIAMESSIVYSAGFFLTVCPDAMIKAAEMTAKTNSLYAVNLAAPFITEIFKDPLNKVIGLSDFVFGNETEAASYGKANGVKGDSVLDVARHIAGMKREKAGRMRTCVITQGSSKTILVRSDGLFMEVPVAPLSKHKMVDANAAGDAFVGGFLAALAEGQSMETCVLTGHKCARYIIQRSGCSFEGSCALRLNSS